MAQSTSTSNSNSTSTSASVSSVHAASNLVVLVGTVTGPPTRREVGAGVAWQFDVATVVADDGRARRVAVPVNWFDPSPAQIEPIDADVEVLVVGTVRRRFFRVGGATQSRTEVAPDCVVPTRRRASVRSALAAATARLQG